MWSVSKLSALMRQQGIVPRKRWGQNFLIDKNIVTAFAEQCRNILKEVRSGESASGEHDYIWEIGAGLGAITHYLLDKEQKLCVFEMDAACISSLREMFKKELQEEDLILLEGNVLDTWNHALQQWGKPLVITGNLPFNASGRIIHRAILTAPACILFILQQEAALRLCANPESKSYSPFSVLAQATYRLRLHKTIASQSFFPRPGVTAAIIELRQYRRVSKKTTIALSRILFTLFAHRRKQIRKSLSLLCRHNKGFSEKLYALFEAEKDALSKRPEELPVQQWLSIAEAFTEKNNNFSEQL